MTRSAAMLVLGTMVLAPLSTRAGDTFACRDADGVWIFGNVERQRCVGKVKTVSHGKSAQPVSSTVPVASGAEARALILAPTAFREHVKVAAKRYDLSEELLHAVMAVESGFRPTAVSDKGAQGLMQLMPGTARDMYVQNPWSPQENIEGGARYLRILANQYQGDLGLTLAAYNAGPEAVRKAGGIPRIPETQEYVRKVLAIYWKLKGMNDKG